jgi:hypothetical protein
MKEIAETEENEATKRKKQGGSSRQREKASQEMESVFTTEDHDGDYDDFVSFNFDNYQSFISYFKLTKLINIFLFRLITWIMISIIVNEEICVGQEYPRSSTLKEIIRYSRIALDNSERKAAGSMFFLIQKIIVLSLVGSS